MPLRKRRFDPQPTAPATVLLASSGAPFSKAAIGRARELAAGEPIAVLTILRVYGSTFGMPNPGLMPTRKERDQQVAVVGKAIDALERRGCAVDAQIAQTRSAGRTIAKVARARRVRFVVMDAQATSPVRRFVEGDVTSIVRRRLPEDATLELVDRTA